MFATEAGKSSTTVVYSNESLVKTGPRSEKLRAKTQRSKMVFDSFFNLLIMQPFRGQQKNLGNIMLRGRCSVMKTCTLGYSRVA